MAFDPLHKWLGIGPSEQPPDHYRLLGIQQFEDDPDVIDAAADKQLAFLYDLCNGPQGEAAEELSNRVSAARLCLCNERKRQAYDAALRQKPAFRDRKQQPKPRLRQDHSHNSLANPHLSSPNWSLRHADHVQHGPYAFASLEQAASLGHIESETELLHPVATGGEWIAAFAVPRIATLSISGGNRNEETPSRTSGSRVKICTRPRRRTRSPILAVISSLVPTLVMAALVYSIYSRPDFRTAIANRLTHRETVQPPVASTHIPSRRNRTSKQPRVEGIQSDQNSDDIPRPAPRPPQHEHPNTRATNLSASQSASAAEQQTQMRRTGSTSRLVNIPVDLTSNRWTETLPGVDRDADCYAQLFGSPTSIRIEPPSGELSPDHSTTISFTDLAGLRLELTIAEAVDSKALKLIAKFTWDPVGKARSAFQLRNIYKQRNYLAQRILATNQARQALIAEQARYQRYLDARGTKPLNLVNEAEAKVKILASQISAASLQCAAAKQRAVDFDGLVQGMNRLDENGRLLVRIVEQD